MYLLEEFGNQLLIDSEDHEAAVLGPLRSLALVTLVSDKKNSEKKHEFRSDMPYNRSI